MVSIIIPAWQAARTLPKTLKSLGRQTYSPIEIIIVDDGSTDDLKEAIAPWENSTRFHRLEKNSGAPHARNVGFALSSGEYVMFADADVVFRPEALAELVRCLEEHSEAAYAYPSFHYGWKYFGCGPWKREKLFRRNFIHTSALIRRSAHPCFDESLKRFQDWDLWLTFEREGKRGVWCPKVLYRTLLGRGKFGMSSWMPSFWHALPWQRLGWMPKNIREYEAAAEVVRKKHNL